MSSIQLRQLLPGLRIIKTAIFHEEMHVYAQGAQNHNSILEAKL